MGRLSWGIGALLFLVPGSAFAQPIMTGLPVIQPLAPIPPGQDTLSKPDARDAMALEPMRLSLLSAYVPHPWNTPGCTNLSGTGVPEFGPEGAGALGVKPFGSKSGIRLTLFGFSRGGCGIDGAIGGGATLSVPITNDVFFAWGGGAIYLPQRPGAEADKQTVEMRADIVFKGAGGRAYTVGISAVQGSPRVSFGGIF